VMLPRTTGVGWGFTAHFYNLSRFFYSIFGQRNSAAFCGASFKLI